MTFQRFGYDTLDDLLAQAEELGVALPATRDLSPLAQPVTIGWHTTPNALGVQPMEGCDGTPQGRPDELTYRRYERFARGGAGLLWFEATAITPESRANPRQLLINEQNAPALAELRRRALEAGQERNGSDYRPFTVLQLTHSGRYSRPEAAPAPIIAHHDGILDEVQGLPEDYPLISDAALDALQGDYVRAARLAHECGFDAVDVKSCHRYLLSELLAAHTRPGRYGGSFENRTRMLRQVVGRIRQELPDLIVAVRLNVYDGHPYPWGWGVAEDDAGQPDLSEPIRLVQMLEKLGVALVNVTAGNPYYTPHINRPFDRNVIGGYRPEEHPLVGVARLIGLAREIRQNCAKTTIMGSGYSWLRQYVGNVAAAVVAEGWTDIVGVGRGAFAYPDFARDLLREGALDPDQVCIACSHCTQIMRDHGRTGCVVRDREVYAPIFAQGRRRAREAK